jgi:hypothetical protein
MVGVGALMMRWRRLQKIWESQVVPLERPFFFPGAVFIRRACAWRTKTKICLKIASFHRADLVPNAHRVRVSGHRDLRTVFVHALRTLC